MKQLENKVTAVNMLNEAAEKILNYERDNLEKLVGKKAFKADNTLMSKYEFEKLEVEFKNKKLNPVVTYSRNIDAGWLRIYVRLCINGGDYSDRSAFTIYENISLYIYKVVDGVIEYPMPEAVSDFSHLKERFSAKELQAKADEANEVAKQYIAAASKVDYRFRDMLNVRRLD